MHEKQYHIGITGSYGGMNLGDEAILETIIHQLKAAMPSLHITVFTKDCEDTLHRHPVDNAVAIQDLIRKEAQSEIENIDLLILGGGGILYDRDVKLYLREVEIAHELGIPVVIYAIGTGPLNDPENRKSVVKNLSRAAAVTVRDRQALKQLEEVGVKQKIILTADPALLLEPTPLPPDAIQQEGLDRKHRLVGFSVREPGPAAPDMDIDHYHALLADTADFMVSRLDAKVIFVPLEQKVHDPQHSHGVISRMRHANRATVLKGKYTSGQLLTLISHFEFCVGMRLHFLIFSAIQGIPFAALPYAAKVQGFLEELEMPVPPLQDITTGNLIAYIDRVWDMRAKISKQISSNVDELKQRASQTNRIVLDVLKNHPRKRD
jgi:polysaccharide pyruvyl transferase CsaB